MPVDAPPPRHRFCATGHPALFAELGHRFLGPEIGVVSQVGAEAVA